MVSLETAHNLELSTSFIDESFLSSDTVNSYQLILHIGLETINLAVKDLKVDKFIALETFSCTNVYSFQQMFIDEWKSLKEKSNLLKHKYKSLVCIPVNNKSTLVPNPVYDDSKAKSLLELNVQLESDDTIMSDQLIGVDAINIYAVPSILLDKLKAYSSSFHCFHFSSSLIEELLLDNKNKPDEKLYVHIQKSQVELLFVKEKKLTFYNSFNYRANEDLAYFVLFACEQLQLHPESLKLEIFGEVEKHSDVHKLLRKYVRNIEFGSRNDTCDFSYQLQTLPKHFYITLFSNFYSYS